MRKLRLRRVKCIAQGHTASKWPGHDRDVGLSIKSVYPIHYDKAIGQAKEKKRM